MALRKRTADPEVPSPPQLSVEALLLNLVSSTADLRRSAAVELGARREGAAALAERLSAEDDRTVRESIVHALIAVGSPESALTVAPLLASDDATLRNQARGLLHALPGAEAVADVLLAALDPDVRMFALEVLATRLLDAGAERIMNALVEEQDVNVCAHGAEQLGVVGTEAQLEPLTHLSSRFPDEDFLHFTVEQASDRIRKRTAAALTLPTDES